MSISNRVRKALRARSSGSTILGLCEICGHGGTNAHHRRNRSQGGRDVLSNLILVCGSGTTLCHGAITENPNWAESRGYTIKGTQAVSSETRVFLPLHGGWVLLDDDGGWSEASDAA